MLENGTNIIYLGWPECNWCRSIVPVLIDVAKSNEIENIYYYNFKNARVAYENDNDVNKSKIYEKIVSVMGDDLVSVFDEESPRSGEKKVLAPTVIFIKNGVYVGSHTKTVESHIKATDDLTEVQIKELTSIYQKYIDLINLEMCYQEGC
jgi:thiol-disulfide isomerase/thioredoxin